MHRPLLAVQHKLERFAFAQKFISDIIICLSAIDLGNDVIQIVTAYLLSEFQMKPIHKQSLLPWKHTFNLDICNHKRISMEIICFLL